MNSMVKSIDNFMQDEYTTDSQLQTQQQNHLQSCTISDNYLNQSDLHLQSVDKVDEKRAAELTFDDNENERYVVSVEQMNDD